MKNFSQRVAVCTLSDDVSNSGIVAAMAVIGSPSELEIIELCISCRALGRGAEKYMFHSLLGAANINATHNIKCRFNNNPRNLVAQSFRKEYFIGEDIIKLNYKLLKQSVPNFEKFS